MTDKTENKNACVICGAPLIYTDTARKMECAICHEIVESNASCQNGHFVCDKCHSAPALSAIRHIGLQADSQNPLTIAKQMMNHPAVHMHGPEHHVLGGAALLSAYRNSGGELDLENALSEMEKRGKNVPGGTCGFWGCCGAAISAGIFLSIVTGTTPMASETWGSCNLLTSECLRNMSAFGGPRCCKRTSFISIQTAAHFAEKVTGIKMELTKPFYCSYSQKNRECLEGKCPFYPRYRLKRIED